MKNPFSKQPKLKFKTAEAEKKSRTALWLGIFIAFVVLIVIVSFSILLKEYNYDLSTMFQNPDDVKKTTSSVTENKSNEQSNITILFSGVSTDKSDIYYISLINVNTKDRTFEVKDYSPSDYVTYYTKDAESGLVKALEDSSKSTIDRYVIVSEDNYKKFMNCLGTVTVTSYP